MQDHGENSGILPHGDTGPHHAKETQMQVVQRQLENSVLHVHKKKAEEEEETASSDSDANRFLGTKVADACIERNMCEHCGCIVR